MVCFLMQGSAQWDGTHVATSAVMIALLCAIFFIPAAPQSYYEVRGNGESFPLNGPAWSLFFEYIGNILYALFIRRLSNKYLSVFVVLLGVMWGAFAIFDGSGYGNIGVGWSLIDYGFLTGLLRMLFPFTLGMLVRRNFKPIALRGAFAVCSAILLLIFLVPNITSQGAISLNGVYEFVCISVIFPGIVTLGASAKVAGKSVSRLCNYLGNISFPLYITHYPVMYLFYAWMIDSGCCTLADTWQVTIAVCLWNLLFATICMKFYDMPVRKIHARKYLHKQ
jgi:peptidoglycan/LPS O-acetylase OafA/YrhL